MLAILFQAAAEPLTWAAFLRDLMTLLIQAAGAALLGALMFLVKSAYRYLLEKKQIEVSDAMQKRIDEAITKGVAAAQEWGMRTLVPDVDGKMTPATGPMKQDIAIQSASRIEPAVKELGLDTLQTMVDAKLQLMRKQLSLPPPPAGSASLPPAAPLTAYDYRREATTTGRKP